MIITVESVSQGTAGQLPACLTAILSSTLAAFFFFSFFPGQPCSTQIISLPVKMSALS